MSILHGHWDQVDGASASQSALDISTDDTCHVSPGLFDSMGQKKYSISAMKAVRDSMGLDWDDADADDNDDANKDADDNDQRDESSERVDPIQLPYESNQYSPANPDGHRKYSNKFLKAVCRSMLPELDKERCRALLTHPSDLPYDDGQYSPSNLEGRKRYSIKFLKAMGGGSSLNDLEDDISSLLSERPSYRDHLTTGFSRWPHNSWDDSRRTSPWGRSSNGQQATLTDGVTVKPDTTFLSDSLSMMKTAEHPWQPEMQSDKRNAIAKGLLNSQRLVKLFLGYLNKLTPTNCSTILNQISDLHLDAVDAKSLADMLFEKAINEPKYCGLYANVCSHVKIIQQFVVARSLSTMRPSSPYEGLNLEDGKREIKNETNASKRLLLFELLYENMHRCRAKHLGLIRLISELYKLDILPDDVIQKYMAELISEGTSEAMEFLCSLVSSVGAKMDTNSKVFLNQILIAMTVSASSVETRIKFKILDTLELQERNWQPKTIEEGPKKIADIHNEFAGTSASTNNKDLAPARARVARAMEKLKISGK